MIFIDELRIGNWVERIGFPLKVTGIKGSDIWLDSNGFEFEHYFYDGIKPIPITKYWIDKFKIGEPIKNQEGLNLAICFRAFPIAHWKDESMTIYINDFVKIHVKYVHQLQNLHHALTGEEL